MDTIRRHIYLLHQYVDINAELYPEKIALIENGKKITWKEYAGLTNYLAAKLTEAAAPRSRVVLIVNKNIAGYCSLVASMKAGLTYIPVDPKLPEERFKLYLKSAQAGAVVVSSEFLTLLPLIKEVYPDIDIEVLPEEFPFSQEYQRDERVFVEITEKDIAYILFTSGTTGVPKGVMISHRSLLNYCQWASAHSNAGSDDLVLGHTPLVFDVSIYGFGVQMVSGAALVAIPMEEEQNVEYIYNALNQNRVTIWISAPSLLTLFCKSGYLDKHDYSYLHVISYCAEVLPNSTLIAWMKKYPEIEYHNLYGPTEATVSCLGHHYTKIPELDDPIPIGIPHPNTVAYIIDENGNQITEPGERGEIVIHGSGVSIGYFNMEEKTREQFNSLGLLSSFQNVYHTGDIGYRNEQGVFYFIGRKDNQIKIRGFRVELGDIEFALGQHELVVRNAAFCVFSKKFDQNVIVVYAEVKKEIRDVELRQYLSNKLPKYMIPFKITIMDEMPQNRSGKIDRKKLQEMAGEDIQ